MRISVQVKPGAKQNLVTETDTGLKVQLRAQPVEGKANTALICVLADHYKVRRSDITIKSGFSSRIKIVEIEDF